MARAVAVSLSSHTTAHPSEPSGGCRAAPFAGRKFAWARRTPPCAHSLAQISHASAAGHRTDAKNHGTSLADEAEVARIGILRVAVSRLVERRQSDGVIAASNFGDDVVAVLRFRTVRQGRPWLTMVALLRLR